MLQLLYDFLIRQFDLFKSCFYSDTIIWRYLFYSIISTMCYYYYFILLYISMNENNLSH